ncbi:MAG: TonB family protein [Terriglobales bacterium]
MSQITPPSGEGHPWSERRRHERKIVSPPVTVDLGGELQALMIDVGEGGMQVQPYGSLERGDTGDLWFEIPGKQSRFEGTAIVAWVGSGGRAGIQFVNVPEASRALLREWLSSPGSNACAEAPVQQPATEPVAEGNEFAALAPEVALQLIAERAAVLTGAHGAAIAVGDQEHMQCRASVGNAPDVGVPLDRDSGLSGLCLRTSEVIQCDDTENDPRVEPVACRQLQLRSAFIVPVLAEARLVAILEVFSSAPFAFQARDRERLTRLAGIVAAVLTAGGEGSTATRETATAAKVSERAGQAVEEAPPAVHSEPAAENSGLTGDAASRDVASYVSTPAGSVAEPVVQKATAIPMNAAAIPMAAATAPTAAVNTHLVQHRHTVHEPEVKRRRVSPVKTLLLILLLVALLPLLGVDPRRQFRRASPPVQRPATSAASTTSTLPAAISVSQDELTPASLGSGDSPLTLGSRVEGCKLIHKVNPVYPVMAGPVPTEKTVLLGVTVTKEGTVKNVHVLKGEPALAKAAVTAVRQWRYQPYLVDGRPTEVETVVTVQFSPPKK